MVDALSLFGFLGPFPMLISRLPLIEEALSEQLAGNEFSVNA
jgi:hypothetical protein